MTAKKTMGSIHSHLAFLKRTNRKTHDIAITPSTTKYPYSVQLRHVLKVHAVYSSDRRRDCQYCRPAASWRVTTPILCASRRLLVKDRGQDKQEVVDHGLHAVDMVRDVVEIWCHFGADAGKYANELSHQLYHSPERALEPREFGP